MHDTTPAQIVSTPVIRPAEPADVDVLHRFVVELAEVEKHPEPVAARPQDLADALFGPRPVAEAVVATIDGRPAGFALFYPSYSTILGRPGIHLDDLYVSPEHRGSGLGRALLAHLADLALRRGGGRLEWWVLRTNDPAIRFYNRLNARELDEIAIMRLAGEALEEARDLG
ncbi:GNAT family N-acetyltransferase [Microtetraspora sp. NBRC 13810]|uniref:GNAT family N-acetyltransferase n=1 Tax=Microtetraspora sp. NBRC 13810 TaxID=3030990 RepID=UPI0025538E18|nr:GNAT family N-acetyltransferase [Microtetraspora sp. NBRC 13810]